MHAADSGTGLPMKFGAHPASRDPRHAPTDISHDQHLRDADYIATNGAPPRESARSAVATWPPYCNERWCLLDVRQGPSHSRPSVGLQPSAAAHTRRRDATSDGVHPDARQVSGRRTARSA